MQDDFERLLGVYRESRDRERARRHDPGSDRIATILRHHFDRSSEGMFISSADGEFILVNAAFSRLLGYTPKELTSLPVEGAYAMPAERRRFRGTIDAAGRVHNFRLVLRKKSGDELAVFVDAVVFSGGNGSNEDVGGYVGSVRVESRPMPKRTESDEFDLALRSGAEGHWMWQIASNEMRFSERFKTLLGYEEHEFHDSLQEWTSRIHPEDRVAFRDALTEHLHRQRPVFASYFRMLHRDGTYRWMMGRGQAEFDKAGTAVRIGGSVTNVSAHMRMIEKLKGQHRELEDEKQRVEGQRDILSRYLPEELRTELANRGEAGIEPRNDSAAVLVVGIPEVDHYHARLSPSRFVTFVNELVADISDLIHGFGGAVARVEGDVVVATFGTVMQRSDDVDRSFRVADAVMRYIAMYNDVREVDLPNDVSVSIGVSFGRVFSGTTGGAMRLDYTVFGRAIRRARVLYTQASRIGSVTLCDEAAASRVSSAVSLTAVKNRNGDAKVYRLDQITE